MTAFPGRTGGEQEIRGVKKCVHIYGDSTGVIFPYSPACQTLNAHKPSS